MSEREPGRAGTGDPATAWRYRAEGRNAPGGKGELIIGTSRVAFDGAATMGGDLPGPADLLAGALAACILKNVERFSGMLPFRYAAAAVSVELTREEQPPRIVQARYVLTLQTDEPPHRVDLLQRNIERYGTITNTLAAACDVKGEVLCRDLSGTPRSRR